MNLQQIIDKGGPWERAEIIGDCLLIQGDCLEVMRVLPNVDAVVTDPPYGIEDIVGGYGRDGRRIENDTSLDAMRDGVRGAWSLVDRGWAFVFYSSRITPAVMQAIPSADYFGEVVWNKKAPGMGKNIRYQHENVAVLRRGETSLIRDLFSVVNSYRVGELHPHQKPVGLMRDLVSATTAKTVLDPFAGSGSTVVACAELGLHGIGIELTGEYFDIACKRVREAYAQPDLFVAPPQQETVQELMDL